MTTTITTTSGATVEGVRIADMPDLGAFTADSSLVGEHAGSGRFGAAALGSYFLPLAGGTLTGTLNILPPVVPGVSTPMALYANRTGSHYAEPAMFDWEYTINDVGPGGSTGFQRLGLINLHIQNVHDAGGAFVDGPSTNSIGLNVGVGSSAARASTAGSVASQHIALWSSAIRDLDPAFTPSGVRPYASLWGQIWNCIDRTNLPSSLTGHLLNENDMQVNNLDDANNRQMMVFSGRSQNTPGAGVVPYEIYQGLYLGGDGGGGDTSSQGTFKTFMRMEGNYSVAAIDMRNALPLRTTIATTLGAPSTTVAVVNVLPFTSANDRLDQVGPSNTIRVLIGASTYICSGYTLSNTTKAAGTITLTAPVSVADATAGNAVRRLTSNGLWLGYQNTIAFDDGGTAALGWSGVTNGAFYSGTTFTIGHFDTTQAAVDAGLQLGNTGLNTIGPNQALGIGANGTGAVLIGRAPDFGVAILNPAGTVVNTIQLEGGPTGAAPKIQISGTDTNVDLTLAALGTGRLRMLSGMSVTTVNAANDAAAASAGVPVGGVYRNASTLMVRVT